MAEPTSQTPLNRATSPNMMTWEVAKEIDTISTTLAPLLEHLLGVQDTPAMRNEMRHIATNTIAQLTQEGHIHNGWSTEIITDGYGNITVGLLLPGREDT